MITRITLAFLLLGLMSYSMTAQGNLNNTPTADIRHDGIHIAEIDLLDLDGTADLDPKSFKIEIGDNQKNITGLFLKKFFNCNHPDDCRLFDTGNGYKIEIEDGDLVDLIAPPVRVTICDQQGACDSDDDPTR